MLLLSLVQKMAVRPPEAPSETRSEGWYRYGESNPNYQDENLAS